MKTRPSSEPWIPVLFVIIAILGISLALNLAGSVKSVGNPSAAAHTVSPSPSAGPSQGVKFAGTLTADGCATSTVPVGDVGCSMTLNGSDVVIVMHGNTRTNTSWGTMVGFPAYPKNPVGSTVEVYAHQLGAKQFTLQGSSSFYVKLVN